ncbi:metalloregulator ArsR/SmtB family transcription factor [Flavobacterium soyae]|uniref:Metalloregulator ArsR/SmtB family transcription factor n=1 Tax=Flavobacterium soyae TaxID=2903098 RepID=A0ABZ2UAY2_9FLAO
MNKRDFKNAIYGELAKITKAMANPHRMEIIDLLAQGPFAVEQVASHTGMSIANTSQHLQVLKTAGLVMIDRKGNFIYYALANENVFDAWRSLRELGMKQNTEARVVVDEFRKNYHSLKPVETDEIYKKVCSGEIILLDVRSEEEFKLGHIHQALSIPVDQILTRLKELSKEKEIIAYCRGPFCVYADQAVEILIKNGFKANRMKEGYPDWKFKNFPISVLQ